MMWSALRRVGLLFVVMAIPLSVFASEDSCSLAFLKPDWRSTLDRLDALNPVALDTPTLRKGLTKFWREMRSLNKGFAAFDEIRSAYEAKKISSDEAKSLIERLATDSADVAEAALDAGNGSTSKGRKKLEAHRTLLKSLDTFEKYLSQTSNAPKTESEKRRETLQKKLKEQKERQAEKEKQEQGDKRPDQDGKPGEEQQDKPSDQSDAKSSDQNGKSNEQQGKQSDQLSKPADQKEKSSAQNSKSSDKDGKPGEQQEKPSDQSGKPSEQSGKPSDQQGKPSDQQGKPNDQSDKSPTQNSKSSDRNGKSEEQQGKQSDQQGQPTAQKEGSSAKDSKSSDKDGKPGEQQEKPSDQSGKPSEQSGKPLNQQGKPSDQTGKPSDQSGKPSDQAGKSSDQSGKSDEQQGKQSDQQGKSSDQGGKPSDQSGKPSDQQGKPSDQAGKPSNQNGKPSDQPGKPSDQSGKPSDQTGKPSGQPSKSDSAKKLGEKGQKSDQKNAQKGDQKNRPQRDDKPRDDNSRSAGNADGERSHSDSLLDMLKEMSREKQTADQMRREEKRRLEAEKAEEKREEKRNEQRREREGRRPKETRERPKIDKNIEDHALQRAMLKSLLVQALREYGSSERVMFGLKEVQAVAQGLKGLGNDVAETYLNRITKLKGELEAFAIVIKDFNQLSADIQIGLKAGDGSLLAKLHFLEKVLSTLSGETTLTPIEERTLDRLRKIIAKSTDEPPPTDEELVEQLLRQMPGPLGRDYIKSAYRAGDSIDYKAAANHIRGGVLNGLTMLSQLKRATQFRSFTRPIPAERFVQEGFKLPIDDVDPQLEVAEDLTYIRNIHRDGPVANDIERLASGDLMERTYRESIKVRGQKNPKENELYIMLYDMSDSMKTGNKYIFQAAVMGSTVDTAQLKVAKGNKVSFLAVPFQANPGTATKIMSPKQAAEFFANMIRTPPNGNGGTSIDRAIAHAFNLIEQAQANGGELSRAHILVFTDGDDEVNAATLEKRKAEISKDTAISIHAISMGEGNADLEKIAKSGLESGQGGRSSYQYFTYGQITQMMSSKVNLENLNAATKARKASATKELIDSEVRDLNRTILELRNENERMLETQNSYELNQFLRDLNRTGPSGASQLARYVSTLVQYPIAADDSKYRRYGIRLTMAHTFFSVLAKENQATIDDVVAGLSQEEKSKVLEWIAK